MSKKFDTIHLLETPHGKRFWRFNIADSDDSRGENHVMSFPCIEEDCEEVGRLWMSDELYGKTSTEAAQEVYDNYYAA